MAAKTALGPEIDVSIFKHGGGLPKGVRKNGFYEVPGRHHYDGMYLSPLVIPAELERIRHLLELNEKDVVSSSYPKTGNTTKLPECAYVHLCACLSMSCYTYLCIFTNLAYDK